MQNVNSYNSQYPLDYYEVGAVYSFYTDAPSRSLEDSDGTGPAEKKSTYPAEKNDHTGPAEKQEGTAHVSEEGIERYKKTLDSLKDEPGIGEKSIPGKVLVRFLGVVIKKTPAADKQPASITVLVRTRTADGEFEYARKKYVVGVDGVFCDDKEGNTAAAYFNAEKA